MGIKRSDISAKWLVVAAFLLCLEFPTAALGAAPEARTEKDSYAPTEPITVYFENSSQYRTDYVTLAPAGAGYPIGSKWSPKGE